MTHVLIWRGCESVVSLNEGVSFVEWVFVTTTFACAECWISSCLHQETTKQYLKWLRLYEAINR